MSELRVFTEVNPNLPKGAGSAYDHLGTYLLATPGEPKPAWVMVDDLSCALTLAVLVDDRQLAGEPYETPTTLARLCRLVERYLEHPTVRTPGLLRRPALQLLLMPRREALEGQRLEAAVYTCEVLHRGLEERIGVDLPDFRLTLCVYSLQPTGPEELPETLLARLPQLAQVFHLRGLGVLEPPPALFTRKDLTSLVDLLNQDGERMELLLRDRTSALSNLSSPTPLDLYLLYDSAERLLRLDMQAVVSRTAGVHSPSADGGDVTVHRSVAVQARICARHWQKARQPAQLPLTPLTLVFAENAAGKTSFAECVSLLTAGYPRARPLPPKGSETLEGWAGLDILGFAPDLRWASPDLMPIYSDDVDLSRGQDGALAMTLLWASLDYQDLPQAFGRFSRAVRALEQHMDATHGVQATNLPEPPIGHFEIPSKLLSRLYTILDILYPDPEGANIPPDEWALFQDWQGRPRQEGIGVDQLPWAPDPGVLAPVWSILLPKLLDGESPELRMSEQDFSEILMVSDRLGARGALIHELTQRWHKGQDLLRRRMSVWEDNMEAQISDVLFPGGASTQENLAKLEKAWDLLLCHDVYDTSELRLNTAAQVRRALARRLARTVMVSPHTLPMLLLDEPTLGQHRSASARVLARFTRLTRAVESNRWRSQDPHQIAQIHHRRLDTRQMTPGHRAPGLAYALPAYGVPALLPPQLLIFSFQEQALTALAQLEGEVHSPQTQTRLQDLVAPWLRAHITSVARSHHKSWNSQNLEDQAVCPHLLLQVWRPGSFPSPAPPPDPREATDWQKRAREALQQLGLRDLAHKLLGPPSDKDLPIRETLDFAQDLVRWLGLTGLLPAALEDGSFYMQVAGVELRTLRYEGGSSRPQGAQRLRRVTPAMLRLPSVETPVDWAASPTEAPIPAQTQRSPQPVAAELAPPQTASPTPKPDTAVLRLYSRRKVLICSIELAALETLERGLVDAGIQHERLPAGTLPDPSLSIEAVAYKDKTPIQFRIEEAGGSERLYSLEEICTELFRRML